MRTLAGSGVYAMNDGPQAKASFKEPDGIAASRDGTLYVADASANDVRAIVNGVVRTVAGSPQGAAGFADGPSASALFHRPVGVAVAKDGTVYVADSLNFCIRRIAAGVVTTFAGTGAPGKADGIGRAASFMLPKGVAVDDDGNVYVADYGVGLRRITPDGSVGTMNVLNSGLVNAVSARGSGNDLIVDYTDNVGIHIFYEGKHRGLATVADGEPWGENNRIGNAFGIAVVDRDSMVITDLWTHAVRYVNFNDPPFRPAPKTRTLAGGKRDGALAQGGYRDGPSDVALVNSPYGLAYTQDGRVLVADSGNRRIREVAGLDTRLPLASDLNNLAFPPHTYRIALVGDSYTWNAVLWPESMGGILESGLAANQSLTGTAMKASILLLSASGGTLHSASDFITTNLGDGQADLVILVYDKFALEHEFDLSPTLRAGNWKTVLPARIRRLAAQLRRQGTKFALLPIPQAYDVSSTENAAAREFYNEMDVPGHYRSGIEFENVLAGAQTHVIPLLRALADVDRRPGTPPLYNASDGHLTSAGSTLVGRELLADLLAWKPWSDVSSHQ